ncbi:excinuclease ABC subunit UvrB [Patescibacteria group bacterium]|nr:excinuclease ABC subunit UvrB [Patescibacteria group bacterium]
MQFKLKTSFQPAGDQPQAINKLVNSISKNNKHQTLLGVTGSGKTFTVAKIIEKLQLPTLIISHNKTLAGQLYQEFRDFFPKNAVSYFVSYYDYYQPEAYIPQSDTYIEKETSINPEIDKLRLTSTSNLLTRPDTIVVASVSCIYGLGSPDSQEGQLLYLTPGQVINRHTLASHLVSLQYQRTTTTLTRGTFRLTGNHLEIYPSQLDVVYSIQLNEKIIKSIQALDPLNFTPVQQEKIITIYPAKHYLANQEDQKKTFKQIRQDLRNQIKYFKKNNMPLEAHRIEQKVEYDLQMIQELGYVNGIENYSRYFDGRATGSPPFTLLDYFHYNVKKFKAKNFLTVIDESHISLPQIRGMFKGDQSRKANLINFGFRLPAALDNRPLTFTEFQRKIPLSLYTSATPTDYEISLSNTVAKQVIRPTGLLDPKIIVLPTKNQIVNLTKEILKRKTRGERVLVLTITKKMAEELAEHLTKQKNNIKAEYLHSDIKTLDRGDILDNLRKGDFDCLIGINLLREGLDLPEVSLIAILDADKEGFLRTSTSLIQIMGRAARHANGQVILFADKISPSMQQAMDTTKARRKLQTEFNLQNNIIPKSISKPIRDRLLEKQPVEVSHTSSFPDASSLTPKDKKKLAVKLKTLMNLAAKNWDFEKAAKLRDHLKTLG